MPLHKIIYPLILLSLSLMKSSAQQNDMPYIDLRIIPVGSVPLAKFGAAPAATKPPASKTDSDTEKSSKKESSKEAVPEGGGSGVSVINLPEDERPISNLYVKIDGAFHSINCQQNRISAPYRIFYKEAAIVFYRKLSTANSSASFKEVFTYTVDPSQNEVLVTLSKPLNEAKWTNPIVKSYNLSHLNGNQTGVTVINTSPRINLGLKLNNKSSVIKPYGITSPKGEASKYFTVLLAVSSDLKNWFKLQQLTLQNIESINNLVIAYEVSENESPKMIKIIRGKIKHKDFKLPRKVR